MERIKKETLKLQLYSDVIRIEYKYSLITTDVPF